MQKRGQAATEFLMTYGWTILVIMVVIGVLFALGVFDFKTPNTCFVPNPYTCQDIKFSSGTFTMRLTASGIDGMGVNEVTVITLNSGNCALITSSLANAENAPVDITCTLPGLGKGDKFEGTLTANYQKLGGSLRTVSGSFSGTAE